MYLSYCNFPGIGMISKKIANTESTQLVPNLVTKVTEPEVMSQCEHCLTLEVCWYIGNSKETMFETYEARK